MEPDTFVGIDLTDAYAQNPRDVDVAILNGKTGHVAFDTFAWPTLGAGWADNVVDRVRQHRGSNRTVFVVDGPQALAQPERNIRTVEQHLRTPGRTPWQLPVPGERPFAGYLRSSVEFFNALVAEGFSLAEFVAHGADLYEAYPGAAWPRWHCGPQALLSKSTAVGRTQRRTILEAAGCMLPQRDLSHDELDAALCATLGWRLFFPRNGCAVGLAPPPTPCVVPNVAVFRDNGGILREGRILMPIPRGTTSQIGARSLAIEEPQPAPGVPMPHDTTSQIDAPPPAIEEPQATLGVPPFAPTTWIYFAGRRRWPGRHLRAGGTARRHRAHSVRESPAADRHREYGRASSWGHYTSCVWQQRPVFAALPLPNRCARSRRDRTRIPRSCDCGRSDGQPLHTAGLRRS